MESLHFNHSRVSQLCESIVKIMTGLWYFHEFSNFDFLVTGRREGTWRPRRLLCHHRSATAGTWGGREEPTHPNLYFSCSTKNARSIDILYIIYTHTIFYMCTVDILYISLVFIDRCTNLNSGIVAFEFLVLHPWYAPWTSQLHT